MIIGFLGLLYLFPQTSFDLVIKAERAAGGLVPGNIQVNGLRFAYLEGGQGESLVLLHGFGANKDNWTRIGKYLTPHFRVIAPDLTGFGESSPAPDDDYTIRTQVERVRALVRALGIPSFHLGGSSMGGSIAGAYALLYPQEVKSLFLMAPGGVVSAAPSEMYRRLMKGEPNPLVAANMEDYERLLDFVFFERPFIPPPIKAVLMQEAIDHRPLNIKIFEQLIRPENIEPLEERLNSLTVPTLIVWGAHDRVLHVSGARILGGVIPNAKTVVMDEAGHLPMIESPRETAQLYLNFLGRT
jgi:pimeloyl-ACP methyl ester carboxylesterase